MGTSEIIHSSCPRLNVALNHYGLLTELNPRYLRHVNRRFHLKILLSKSAKGVVMRPRLENKSEFLPDRHSWQSIHTRWSRDQSPQPSPGPSPPPPAERRFAPQSEPLKITRGGRWGGKMNSETKCLRLTLPWRAAAMASALLTSGEDTTASSGRWSAPTRSWMLTRGWRLAMSLGLMILQLIPNTL